MARSTVTLPIPGHVYIGGPAIKPAWLRGRRLLVDHVPQLRDYIGVRVLARGRVDYEMVEPKNWDAEVAP